MADVAQLEFSIDSRDLKRGERDLENFGRTGEQASGKVTKFGGAASKAMGAVAIAAGAALAALAGLGAAISTIREFDSSMSKLGAVTGATAAEMEKMRGIARDLGSSTEFSAKQAADGLTFLGMAGFNAAESMAAIPAVLDLATASAMDLGSAADIASNIMSGFGIEAANAANVTDILAAASSRANTDVGQLGSAMSTVAPISKALGINLADTAAAIGVMSDAGIQGERAGTALRGVLASLAGPSTEAESVLTKLGLTIADVDPAMNSLSSVMGKLGAAGLSTADALSVFGREAVSGALVLVDGSARLREFGDELSNVDGAAAKMATTMRDNLGGDIDGLKSAISGLMLSLGDAGLTTVLRNIVQAMTGLAQATGAVVDAFGSALGWLSQFASGNLAAQTAIDNVTLAMGDEIGQAGKLLAQMEPAKRMSIDIAGVKLEQARAHLAAADAQRQEAIELAKSGGTYQRYQRQIEETRQLIIENNELLAGEGPIRDMAVDRVASLNRQLRLAVEAQNEITAAAGGTNEEVDGLQAEIARIQAAIAGAKDGMVVFGGQVITANELTGRLANLAAGVNFSGAISSAQALANALGIALSKALALSATTPMMSDEDMAMSVSVIGGADQRQQTRDAVVNFNSITAAAAKAASAVGSGSKKSLSGASKAASSAMKDAERNAKSLADEIQRLEFDADPVKKYADELAHLNELSAAGLSDGAYAKAVQDLNDGLADSYPLIGSVSDAFGEFVAGGLQDFKGFVSSILNSFKSMLAKMIATAAQNQIMISMGLTGSGAGAAGGMLGGGGGMLGGIGSSLMGGASSVVSGLMSGGLSGGLGAVGTALSGATSGLAGLATAAGAVAVPLLAAYAAFKFFTGSTKELDAGIRLNIEGNELLAESYRKVEKSRFFGLSKSQSTSTSAIDSGPFADAYSTLYDGAEQAAWALGISSKALKDYTRTIDISTKGMSEAEAQQAIMAELQQVNNELAMRFFRDLSKTAIDARVLVLAGEEVGAAMERIRLSVGSASEILDALGHSTQLLGFQGAKAATQLINALGGLEDASANASAYINLFYTMPEKIDIGRKSLQAFMRELGGTGALPQTLEQYRAMIDRQLAAGNTQAAGQLIMMSGQFDTWLTLRNDYLSRDRDAMIADLEERRRIAEQDQAARISERMPLVQQIWDLLGNTAASRAYELSQLDPTNRIYQERIWALKDEKAAMEGATAAIEKMIAAVKPEKFASSFAYNLALSNAARGMTQSRTTATGVPIAAVTQNQQAQTMTGLVAEMAALRKEVAAFRGETVGLQINQNADVRKIRQNSDRDQVVGTPPVRTSA